MNVTDIDRASSRSHPDTDMPTKMELCDNVTVEMLEDILYICERVRSATDSFKEFCLDYEIYSPAAPEDSGWIGRSGGICFYGSFKYGFRFVQRAVSDHSDHDVAESGVVDLVELIDYVKQREDTAG